MKKTQTFVKNMLTVAVGMSTFISLSSSAAWDPKENWEDSYAVNGVCYCNSSNYDHNLDSKSAMTPIGELNVVQICEDIESVLGGGATSGRIPYNDIQCGNGPANDADDEAGCPGRVDIGSEGCDDIGPKWDLVSVYGPWPGDTPEGALDRSDWVISASRNESDAYLAIDNLDSTRWATGTAQANGQWFELDLQSEQVFDAIVLETADNPNDYPRGYQVFVSDNGVDWGTAINSGAGQGVVTNINFDSVSSRYLRIVQTGSSSNNWWSIHEINLFSSGEEPQPLPPVDADELDRSGWSVSASNNAQEAELAIDNSADTRWDSEAKQSSGQTFDVDLGASALIESIVLASEASPNDYPRGYLVYASLDGVNWGSAVASGVGENATIEVSFSAVNARYIRIEQTGNHNYYWWSIHDLAVKGVYSNYDSEQLSSADWMLSASRNTEDLANAIDGNTDTRWTTAQTQVSGQTFTIDMGTAATFDKIVLDSEQSNLDQPRGYELYISNDADNWGNAIVTGEGSADGNTEITFSAVKARFIQIKQTGNDNAHWWSIHELTIFGQQ